MFIRIFCTLLITLSYHAAAQESKHTFKLDELRSKFSLSLSDVYLAQSVSFPSKSDWFNGIIGNEKLGQLAIMPVGSSSIGVEKGIKITAAYTVNDLSFEICEDRFNCTPIDVKGNMNSYIIPLQGSTWEIKRSGFPCKDTEKCELFIPSWALETIRLNNGSMQSFPDLLTFVYHKGGLALYNAKLGKFLFNVANLGPDKIKGNFQAVNLNNDITLLKGNNSAFIFDWKNDRCIKVTADSISKTNKGILSLSESATQDIATFPSNKKRTLVGINSNFIVFSDLIVQWNIDESGSIEVVSQGHLPNGSTAISFTSEDKNNNILIQQDKTYRMAELKKANSWRDIKTFAYSGKGQFEILGDNIYHFGKDGLKILSGNKLDNTSLSDSGKSVYMSDSNNAFIQYFHDSKCEWRHFRVHDKHPESLSSSGVHIDCGQFNGFSTRKNNITLTSYQGVHVQVEQFLGNP